MKLTFSIKEAVLTGWRIFKSRPWLFIGSSIVYLATQLVLGVVESMLPQGIDFLVSFLIGSLISLGFVSFYLKAHDNTAETKLGDLWHPKSYLTYLFATILLTIIVMVGFVLLIVPGIILALALSFSMYLIIEKGLSPIAALKESARITRGNRVTLLLLGLLLGVMNIIGAAPLFIGLFVTVPVSMLASIHVYRLLAARASGAAAPVIETPTPVEPAPAT